MEGGGGGGWPRSRPWSPHRVLQAVFCRLDGGGIFVLCQCKTPAAAVMSALMQALGVQGLWGRSVWAGSCSKERPLLQTRRCKSRGVCLPSRLGSSSVYQNPKLSVRFKLCVPISAEKRRFFLIFIF